MITALVVAGLLQSALSGEEQAVQAQAKAFFTNLLARRIAQVVEESELPSHLEGRRIATRDELAAEWTRNLGDKRPTY